MVPGKVVDKSTAAAQSKHAILFIFQFQKELDFFCI